MEYFLFKGLIIFCKEGKYKIKGLTMSKLLSDMAIKLFTNRMTLRINKRQKWRFSKIFVNQRPTLPTNAPENEQKETELPKPKRLQTQ